MERAQRLMSLRLVLTALALVVGVLSMHAASGGPHSRPGAGHAPVAGQSSSDVMADVMAGVRAEVRAGVTAGVTAVAQAPDLPLAGAAVAALCLAVMLGVAVLLATPRLARSGAEAADRPRLRTGVRLVRAPGDPPREALVRLCVMRT